MKTEDKEKYGYEDFIGSNAAFSFLSSSFSIECLQTFVNNVDKLLINDGKNIDDNFMIIRELSCNELKTLKNLKLALFKFMNTDDKEYYDKFVEDLEEKMKMKTNDKKVVKDGR